VPSPHSRAAGCRVPSPADRSRRRPPPRPHPGRPLGRPGTLHQQSRARGDPSGRALRAGAEEENGDDDLRRGETLCRTVAAGRTRRHQGIRRCTWSRRLAGALPADGAPFRQGHQAGLKQFPVAEPGPDLAVLPPHAGAQLLVEHLLHRAGLLRVRVLRAWHAEAGDGQVTARRERVAEAPTTYCSLSAVWASLPGAGSRRGLIRGILACGRRRACRLAFRISRNLYCVICKELRRRRCCRSDCQ
jgi:hypothetical protein